MLYKAATSIFCQNLGILLTGCDKKTHITVLVFLYFINNTSPKIIFLKNKHFLWTKLVIMGYDNDILYLILIIEKGRAACSRRARIVLTAHTQRSHGDHSVQD